MRNETIEKPITGCRNNTGWRSQFSHPRGWLGRLAGCLMAVKNRERSLWVQSLLTLRPEDRVLELGFGPGVDIGRVARRVPRGFVAGIDQSKVMVSQAASRNAEAIRNGRVELRHGDASRLPYRADSFDTAFSINSAQFWDDAVEVANEIRRVLKPGGRIALAVQPRNQGATEATARETGRALVAALEAAGFKSVTLEQLPAKPVSVVCALATK